MQEIKIFNNPDFGDMRTVIIDGELWAVGKDVASALGYEKERNAISKYVDKEDALKWGIPTKGGIQDMTIINESGIYSLIFGSKLESAKKFKHWVTSEVLPAIHKTGSYTIIEQSPSEIHLGELARYLAVMDRVAHRQNLAPHKIAKNFKKVSEQFGIQLSEDFVNVPEYEQLTLSDIIVRH